MESGVPLTGALKSDPDSTWGVGLNFGAAVGVGTDVAVADEQASDESSLQRGLKYGWYHGHLNSQN